MKRIAKNYLAYSIIVAALLLVCCSDEENGATTLSEIKLNKSVLGIFIGETYTLQVTSNTDDNIQWSSNKPDIATINSDGIVTGVSEGTAVVTSKSGDSKAICTVVISKKTYDLELNDNSLRLYPYPEYAQTLEVVTDIEGNTVIWESSDPSVATVDQTGIVTPITVGEATVTAKFDDFSAECFVEVVDGPVTLIQLDKTELIMKPFEMAQLSIETIKTEVEEIGPAIWQSSDEGIVSVDSNGQLTSFGLDGTVTISVTVDNLTTECTVTVAPYVVYVAGYEGDRATLWKNSEATYLTNESDDAEAESIYVVDNNTIYTTGFIGPSSGRSVELWNNDQPLHTLTDGTRDAKGKAIFFYNGNVYTAGYEDNDASKKIAKIWENNQILYELTDGQYDALAYTIFENAGRLYTAGYEKDQNGTLIAKIWENGTELHVLTNGDYNAIAYAGGILNNDIYTAGYEKNNANKFIAKVWRNGSEIFSLTDGINSAIAYSMYVHNNSVYSAGYEFNDSGKRVAKIWQDGNELYALTNGEEHARAYSIYISISGDIYAAGYEENENGDEIAKVWINGQTLLQLTNGDDDARAYSIIVE